jgi:hypothetical protein
MARPDRAPGFRTSFYSNQEKKAHHEINRLVSRRRTTRAWPSCPAQSSDPGNARHHTTIDGSQSISNKRINRGSQDNEIPHGNVLHFHNVVTLTRLVRCGRFPRSGERTD